MGCTLTEFLWDRMDSWEIPYWAMHYKMREEDIKKQEEEARRTVR